MKNFIYILPLLLLIKTGFSQDSFSGSKQTFFPPRAFASSELGIFAGTSYYTGDLNPGGHFNPNFLHPALGLTYRRNLNNRFALRASGNYGKISGDDAQSESILQQRRNLNFSSHLVEFSALVEFNFFIYNVTNEKPYYTPYIFAGLGGFWFNPSGTRGGSNVKLQPLQTEGEKYSRLQPNFPFGLGIKNKFSRRFMVSVEWGLRKTFTDYLDDVSTTYVATNGDNGPISDPSLRPSGPGGTNVGTQRGNSKTNDWYSFAGVIVSFMIGEKPNNCNTFDRQ